VSKKQYYYQIMTSEQKIIQECRRKNPRYQKLLFEQYAAKMLGVCSRYFFDKNEAQDALMEGFVKVFSNIDKFRGEGSFEGWIRRIMVNTSLNIYRKNLKHYYHDDISESQERIEDSNQSYDHLQVQDMLKLIHSLPPGYRLVFNLFEIEGYSHKEIADKLEISENTSKSQLRKARHKLQYLLSIQK